MDYRLDYECRRVVVDCWDGLYYEFAKNSVILKKSNYCKELFYIVEMSLDKRKAIIAPIGENGEFTSAQLLTFDELVEKYYRTYGIDEQRELTNELKRNRLIIGHCNGKCFYWNKQNINVLA